MITHQEARFQLNIYLGEQHAPNHAPTMPLCVGTSQVRCNRTYSSNTHTHTHTHTHTLSLSLIYIYIHTHTCGRAHTHMRTDTDTQRAHSVLVQNLILSQDRADQNRRKSSKRGKNTEDRGQTLAKVYERGWRERVWERRSGEKRGRGGGGGGGGGVGGGALVTGETDRPKKRLKWRNTGRVEESESAWPCTAPPHLVPIPHTTPPPFTPLYHPSE